MARQGRGLGSTFQHRKQGGGTTTGAIKFRQTGRALGGTGCGKIWGGGDRELKQKHKVMGRQGRFSRGPRND